MGNAPSRDPGTPRGPAPRADWRRPRGCPGGSARHRTAVRGRSAEGEACGPRKPCTRARGPRDSDGRSQQRPRGVAWGVGWRREILGFRTEPEGCGEHTCCARSGTTAGPAGTQDTAGTRAVKTACGAPVPSVDGRARKPDSHGAGPGLELGSPGRAHGGSGGGARGRASRGHRDGGTWNGDSCAGERPRTGGGEWHYLILRRVTSEPRTASVGARGSLWSIRRAKQGRGGETIRGPGGQNV